MRFVAALAILICIISLAACDKTIHEVKAPSHSPLSIANAR